MQEPHPRPRSGGASIATHTTTTRWDSRLSRTVYSVWCASTRSRLPRSVEAGAGAATEGGSGRK